MGAGAAQERVDDGRGELGAAAGEELLERLLGRQAPPVGAVGGHRRPRLGDRDDGGAEGHGVAGEAVRIPGAVPALVVMAHHRHDLAQGRQPVEDRGALVGVQLDLLVLVDGQGSGLGEQRVGDGDVADVVQARAGGERPQLRWAHAELAADGEREALEGRAAPGARGIARLQGRVERLHGLDRPALEGAVGLVEQVALAPQAPRRLAGEHGERRPQPDEDEGGDEPDEAPPRRGVGEGLLRIDVDLVGPDRAPTAPEQRRVDLEQPRRPGAPLGGALGGLVLADRADDRRRRRATAQRGGETARDGEAPAGAGGLEGGPRERAVGAPDLDADDVRAAARELLGDRGRDRRLPGHAAVAHDVRGDQPPDVRVGGAARLLHRVVGERPRERRAEGDGADRQQGRADEQEAAEHAGRARGAAEKVRGGDHRCRFRPGKGPVGGDPRWGRSAVTQRTQRRWSYDHRCDNCSLRCINAHGEDWPVHGCLDSGPAADQPPGGVIPTPARIARPQLAGRMAATLAAGGTVLVVAEAGYGKTTLLEQTLDLLADRHVVALDAGRDWVDAAEAERLLATPGAVLMTRRLPRVSLARARAAGTLLEIGAAELAFDARECAELLHARLGREPGRREVERVLELTEGWPFGVALAAAGGPLGRIRLDAQDAVSFLDEEILGALPPRLHDALLDAAVPDRIDETMAQAVGLEAGAPRDLPAPDLFLRCAEGDGRVPRFPPLFRAAVRARAARERSFEHRARLHGAVAAALAAEGRTAEATDHWLQAGDWHSGLAAVAATGPALMGLGAERLERWLHALVPEARDAGGGWLLEGAHACATGTPERAVEPLSSAIALAHQAGDETAEWSARALLASALHALGEADHARDAAEGFEGPSGWRAGTAAPAAAMSAALALAGAGRETESRALASAALRHPAGASLIAREHLRQAQLDIPRGRLDTALHRVRSALLALPAADPLAQRPALLACAAAILGEQGHDAEALEAWEEAAVAADDRGDRRMVATARGRRALLHARAGRTADAELELGRIEDAPVGLRSAVHDAALAVLSHARGEPGLAFAAAERAMALAARGPLAERLSLAATLAPVVANAGAPGLAADIVDAALAVADERLPGEASGWARARLLVQRAWLSSVRGAPAEGDDAIAAAWEAAGDADVHLVRREWSRLEGLLWAALVHDRLAPDAVLRAIERAWPGGAALVPFTEHPVAAVRRGAVGPVIASGHPGALDQLRDLAQEADPAVAAAARTALDRVRQAPPPLLFRLLGGFEARRGTWRVEAAAWGRPMTARLVRFLLVHRGTVVPEDVLFEVFWPGKPAASARRNLQVAVSMARGVLDTGLADESVIEAVDRGYRLRLADHDILDTEEFEVAARAALVEDAPQSRRALLERAAALWGGEPLPEDRYADWSRDWRRRLTDLSAGVLEALVEACREQGDARATIQAAGRLLELDPLNESVHRELMAAYARCGRIADALKQYLQCRRLLVRERRVGPRAATPPLERRHLAGRPAAPRSPPPPA